MESRRAGGPPGYARPEQGVTGTVRVSVPGAATRGLVLLLAGLMVMLTVGCGSQVQGSPQAATAGSVQPSVPPLPSAPSPTAGPSPTESSSTAALSSPSASVAPMPDLGAPDTSVAPTAATTAGSTATESWQLPDPTGVATYSEFGDIVTAPGRTNAIQITEGGIASTAVVFRVKSIELDKGCIEKAKPENGHFLVISLDVEVRSATPETLDEEGIAFSSYNWEAWTTAGDPQPAINSDAADTCVGDQGFPLTAELDPDGVTSGLVVLDVTEPEGTVVFDAGLDSGWEFSYP